MFFELRLFVNLIRELVGKRFIESNEGHMPAYKAKENKALFKMVCMAYLCLCLI